MAGACIPTKKYVSRKIKAIRWKPAPTDFGRTTTFVTGSWDDQVNALNVWELPNGDGDPTLVSELQHLANVNAIKYVTHEAFAVASGNGSVSLFQHTSSGPVEEKQQWNAMHHFAIGPAACTALASYSDQITSVGEDGRLVHYSMHLKEPLRVISPGNNDGCSIYAVLFVKSSEVVTANMQGHLKLWDLRTKQAAKASLLSPDQIGVHCLAGHPTQQYLVAAGGEDGIMAIWDMRSTSQPVTGVAAHNGPISDLRFHSAAPEHLFSAGVDGQLLHWDASAAARQIPTFSAIKGPREMTVSSVNVWLSSDVAKGGIETTSIYPESPFPFNSLDIDGPTLLAGSDNEAIVVIRQVLAY